MKTLNEMVGKIVFAFGSNIEDSDTFPLYVADTAKIIYKKLKETFIQAPNEVVLAHGVLTSAVSIPSTLPINTKAFILVPEANASKDSYIIEIDTIDKLTAIIEAMVIDEIPASIDLHMQEDICDYLFDIDTQDIENIYIVYGYSIELTYHLPVGNLHLKEASATLSIFKDIKKHQE
jgi:hypothetical protein